MFSQSIMDRLLALNARFGTDVAIISHIRNTDYTLVDVISEIPPLKRGVHYQLNDTYCSDVVKKNMTIYHNRVGRLTNMVNHPVYTAMQLEAYIGAPIWYKESIVGTVNFSGLDPKHPGFNSDDVAEIEQLAADIAAQWSEHSYIALLNGK